MFYTEAVEKSSISGPFTPFSPMSISLNTLSELKAHGHGITVFCIPCGHFAPLDLDKAIQKLGPDFDTIDGRSELLASLKCGKCGSKNLDINRRAPNQVRQVGRTVW